MAGIFSFSNMAIIVKSIVLTPGSGIIPIAMPKAIVKANFSGEMPCFKKFKSGFMSLFLKYFFKAKSFCKINRNNLQLFTENLI